MAYVGFDLDETLGRFVVPHYHTIFLQPHTVLYRAAWASKEPVPLSPTLESKLNDAFSRFASCLASKEPALGLLRPSMIEIVKRLHELKQEGLVKAVLIYSNNGNLALLHLAGKMIEELANAPGLFCNYIHWYHPSRRMEIERGNPGAGFKTLAVLKQAFQSGTCGVTGDIPTKDIYFFDDVYPTHWDLQSKLGNRYFHIAPYKYDVEFSRLDECLKNVLDETGLLEDEEYKEYMAPVLHNNISFERMIEIINQDRTTFLRKLIKPNDTALLERIMMIFPKPTRRNNFSKSLQTLRRLEKKQNEGAPLTSEEQQALTMSRNTITSYEAQHPNTAGGSNRTRRRTKKRSGRAKRTKRKH